MSEHETNETKGGSGGAKLVGVAALVAAALGVAALGGWKHFGMKREAEQRQAEVAAGAYVRVRAVGLSGAEKTLELSGEALPYASTTLYAKLSGYLQRISVDKGDKVRTGEVLGVIQSPETDSAYQSIAADAENKARNLTRAESLYKQQLISLQDYQQAQTDARVSQENLATQAAQKGYQVLKAPFEGVVTARYADPGALLQSATNASTGALPIVTVSKVDRLRVDVYVEQRYAAFVKEGDTVSVSPTDRPELAVQARVARTSGALDPRTRMMLTEVELDNKDGAILPNSFVTVKLKLKTPQRLQVPAEALVMRGDKPFAAVVNGQDQVSFRPLLLGEQDGEFYPVVSGVKPGERVALNLGGDAREGDKVRPVEEK